MEVIESTKTNLSVRNKDRTVNSEFIFIFARPRYGKSLAVESLLELYHKAGYTILCLSDVKDEWEFAYSMFLPEKQYHVDRLKKDGTIPSKKLVKLYHPFTHRIEKGMQPDINFYGFSIKNLGRSEFSLISESAWESDTSRILNDATQNITDSTGLYGFLDYIENMIAGKKEGKQIKRDPNLFGLRVTGGTAKSLQDIASYFLPFKQDSFLVSHNSDLKLDWSKILNDNSHYHIFGTRYLKDPKLKEFCILGLLNSIIANRRKGKKPILIYIPEIRYLVPFRPEGYKKFLAEGMKSSISIMGNMGKGGIAGIFDSQSYTDTDEQVVKSQTKTFLGELAGKDIDAITKHYKMGKNQIQTLIKSDAKRTSQPSFMYLGDPDLGSWTPRFPSHAHAEEEYTFDEMYKKHYPEKLKNYDDLKKKIKDRFKEEVDKIDSRRGKEEAKQKAEELEKKMEKKDKVEEKGEKTKKVINEKQTKIRERDMKLAWEMSNDESIPKKERSIRKIADKLDISKSTIAKYIKEYEPKEEVSEPQLNNDVP